MGVPCNLLRFIIIKWSNDIRLEKKKRKIVGKTIIIMSANELLFFLSGQIVPITISTYTYIHKLFLTKIPTCPNKGILSHLTAVKRLVAGAALISIRLHLSIQIDCQYLSRYHQNLFKEPAQ